MRNGHWYRTRPIPITTIPPCPICRSRAAGNNTKDIYSFDVTHEMLNPVVFSSPGTSPDELSETFYTEVVYDLSPRSGWWSQWTLTLDENPIVVTQNADNWDASTVATQFLDHAHMDDVYNATVKR